MRSQKLDKAVAASRAKDANPTVATSTDDPDHLDDQEDGDGDEETALAIFKAAAGDIVPFDPRKMAQALRRDGYVMAERFLRLKSGQMMEGFLLGAGLATIQDISTGKPKEVTRFRFELSSGARVSLLEVTQLVCLNSLPMDGSCAVQIAKGETVILPNGRKMDEYYVTYKERARKPAAQLVESGQAT